MAAGFPITQDQPEAHLRDHAFLTIATVEQHIEQAHYLTSAAMRHWVMGALREEHQALKQRLVDSVRELHDRTAATQSDFDSRVGDANAVSDQRQAELTADFESRDAQLREHVDRTARANLESLDPCCTSVQPTCGRGA